MTDIQERLAHGQGQVHAAVPRPRHRPGELRGLHLARVLRSRARGDLRAVVALRRAERTHRRDRAATSPVSCPATSPRSSSPAGLDGTVHAFHNVCAHRGNKVVWQEHPQEESSGSCRQFACKYHGWRYGLDGKVAHVTNEEEFFDLDRALARMPKVAVRGVRRVRLREPRRRSRAAAHVPRRPHPASSRRTRSSG